MSSDNYSVFECPKCKTIKDEAKIFPCGIYCIDCSDAILESLDADIILESESKEFWCSVCEEIHPIPKKGFQKHHFKKVHQIKYEINAEEQLKSYLAKIDLNLTEIKVKLENSFDQIKETCIQLKNQVNIETEVLVKKIQDLNKEKINAINEYEEKCALNEKSKINLNFFKEIEIFREKCLNYIKYSEDSEIRTANSLAENILKKIEDQRIQLESSIFSGPVKNLHDTPNESSEKILKKLNFTKSIDLNSNLNSNYFLIKEIFQNMDTKYKWIFEYLDHQKISGAFYGKNSELNLVLINPDLTTYRSWRSEKTNIVKFDYSANNNSVLLCYVENWTSNNDKKGFLIKFDFDLKVEKNSNLYISDPKVTLNDSIICLLDDRIVKVFNLELKFLRQVGQCDSLTDSFYFGYYINVGSIFLCGIKLFVFHWDFLEILNFKTGKKIKSIEIKANKMRLDLNQNLYFWSKSECKISRYDHDGTFIDDFQVDKNISDFLIDKNGKILYFKLN